MANSDDPSTWRLTTPGGIPIKNLGVEGDISDQSANVRWTVIIQSGNLLAFLQELYPLPVRVGNNFIPQYYTLPGLPTMIALKSRFGPLVKGVPVDPFSSDPNAVSGTYGSLIRVQTDFGPSPKLNANGGGPNGYEGENIQITSRTTGEFMNVTARQATKVPQKPDESITSTDVSNVALLEGLPTVDDDEQAEEPVKNPEALGLHIVVPMTEWTITVPSVPYDFYRDDYVHRLRALQGRTNSDFLSPLLGAYPGTVILAGFDFDQAFTWREGQRTAPVQVSLQLIEKRIVQTEFIPRVGTKKLVRGWNDFYDPEKGWVRIKIDGSKPAYEQTPFSGIFDL